MQRCNGAHPTMEERRQITAAHAADDALEFSRAAALVVCLVASPPCLERGTKRFIENKLKLNHRRGWRLRLEAR